MDARCILNYDTLSIGKEHRVYLLVKVKGTQGEEKSERLPLNLSVVIDRSGSMSGEKLNYVKQAARDLIRRLGTEDTLSLVAYDTTVDVLIPPRRVRDKVPFQRAVQSLHSRATTNLSGGWLQGCEFVAKGKSETGVNRVLLLSDGLANVGVTDPTRLAAMARQKRAEGVTTTTFGVGMDFQEELMTKMASQGGGAFYFIDSPDQAPTFFAEELKDLYNVIGQNLTITIETTTVVRSVSQLYDYPRKEQSGKLLYFLGDLYAGEERYQVFELGLAELQEGETRLGRITVSYDAVLQDEVQRREFAYDITVNAVPEGKLKVKTPVVEVELLAIFQKIRLAREKAVECADRGDFDKAKETLEDIAREIKQSEIEDQELLDEYDRLREEANEMEFGRQRYDMHARKLYFQKTAASSRHSRFENALEDMHIRHKMAAPALERNGTPPGKIAWRGGEVRLEDSPVTIGSAPDNDVVLDDEFIAPYHCRIEKEGPNWYLVDLGTGLGTIANSGLVVDRFQLSAGDILRIGRTVLEMGD